MSAQCPYCGAAVFHEGARSTQYQCRTTTYDDGPASRSQVCVLTKELAETRATLSRVEAERDGMRIGSCVWQPADDGGDERHWSTTCKHEFVFLDGGPVENEIKFCPFCGGLVEIDTTTTTEGEKP